jgi:hypothetical protein
VIEPWRKRGLLAQIAKLPFDVSADAEHGIRSQLEAGGKADWSERPVARGARLRDPCKATADDFKDQLPERGELVRVSQWKMQLWCTGSGVLEIY